MIGNVTATIAGETVTVRVDGNTLYVGTLADPQWSREMAE